MMNNTLKNQNTEYYFDWCLEDGNYQFILGDHSRWRDGLCCEAGQGGYSISTNGIVIESDYGEQSWDKKVFDIVINESGAGTPLSEDTSATTCKILEVAIKTDYYPEDTWWQLEKEGQLLFSFPPASNPTQKLTQRYLEK